MPRLRILLLLSTLLLLLTEAGCGSSQDNNPKIKEGTSAPHLKRIPIGGPGGAPGQNKKARAE